MNTVPIARLPYTSDDLSVVIPQVSWHQKRFSWFIPQYLKATPPEVVANTIVAYDGDIFTKEILEKYNLRGIEVQEGDWSTYKQSAGFQKVETRLCVRVHNDCFFPRNDWVQSLIDQFNACSFVQMVGRFHPSGFVSREMLDGIVKIVPSFKKVYGELDFDENGKIGCSFLSAYFTASQTSAFKYLYPLVMKINENKMDKEDCLLTLLASVCGVRIMDWENMNQFAQSVGKSGEWEEEVSAPTETMVITEENRNRVSKPVFKIV